MQSVPIFNAQRRKVEKNQDAALDYQFCPGKRTKNALEWHRSANERANSKYLDRSEEKSRATLLVVRLKAETPREGRNGGESVQRVGFRGERRDNPSFSSRQSFITAATQTHSQPLSVSLSLLLAELRPTTSGLLLVYSGWLHFRSIARGATLSTHPLCVPVSSLSTLRPLPIFPPRRSNFVRWSYIRWKIWHVLARSGEC